MKHKIICGKSEIELKQFEENSFDSCVTDCPYGLEFMGKGWDKFKVGENIAGGTISTGEGSYWKNRPNIPAFYQLNNSDLHAFQQFTYEWATELYRVMKPGAHILVFGGTRTYHRMACAVEDAGFECRDMVEWIYGSGFPKSLNLSLAFDKKNGLQDQRGIGGFNMGGIEEQQNRKAKLYLGSKTDGSRLPAYNEPKSEEAIQWNGWGSNLKPSHEPILLARKPISERNIASNVLKWGVGGLNIDKCRINFNGDVPNPSSSGWKRTNAINAIQSYRPNAYVGEDSDWQPKQGRFPSNLLLECCCECDELVEGEVNSGGGEKTIAEGITSINHPHRPFHYGDKNGNEKSLIHTNPNCVCRMLDMQSGESKPSDAIRHNNQSDISGKKGIYGKFNNKCTKGFSDNGGASRFYYQPKASQAERWFYCTICKKAYPMKERDKHLHNAPEETKYKYLEFHPTQKPESLICYLMRLITPPNGSTIDPFLGSGTAIIAAEREGFNCVGIDSKPEYCEIALRRGKSELIQQKISGTPSTIKKEGF